jgi:hypothetical protein
VDRIQAIGRKDRYNRRSGNTIYGDTVPKIFEYEGNRAIVNDFDIDVSELLTLLGLTQEQLLKEMENRHA